MSNDSETIIPLRSLGDMLILAHLFLGKGAKREFRRDRQLGGPNVLLHVQVSLACT